MLCVCFTLVPIACAQLSLSSAVDLALRGNPRVQGAEDDVKKATAQLTQAHDAYVPSINAGAAVGQSYGYSPYPPTLFTVTGGGLVFSASQSSYIRSARAGVDAAELALDDVREAVAEDAALAFLAMDHDQQREQIVGQQVGFANTLVSIVQSRVDAGRDPAIDLAQAKLTAAQLRLASLRAQDDIAVDRDHLARLIGLPPTALSVDSVFPATPVPLDTTTDTTVHGYANAGVAAAYASAEAKQDQARGDARFRFLPQASLFGQFNYYATFSDSFAQLQKIYQANTGQTTLSASEGAFGVQITLPIMDRARAAKARESAADAAHAFHDAQYAQINALDGQSRLRHSIDELKAQADVAMFEQQLAQQKLDILQQQLKSGNLDGPQMTPKDEQNARIKERDTFLGVLDAGYQLRQAEIHLMRQTGQLLTWLKSTASAAVPAPASIPTPHP
ncbi:MAG TPA: TolC family protein [Acidobacteriaceae bacterium]|jgi:outer membrane protein TolC|nr:TolC family protein [Acidobacteriaceae bacterium]